MAERPIPELSAAARELLREFRAQHSPTPSDRRRTWSGVGQRLERQATSVVAEGRAPRYAKIVAVTMALAATVLLAVKLVAMGVTTLAGGARQPAIEAPYQGAADSGGGQVVARGPDPVRPRREGARDARTRAADSSPEAGVTTASAPTVEEPTAAPSPSAAAPRTRATKATTTAASDLQAELALVKRATSARQAGRIADALAALREHAERFPSGTFADERRVLGAEILCEAGRGDEARAEVRRFLASRSRSALAARMKNVCARDRG